jgi:hypothetical protein
MKAHKYRIMPVPLFPITTMLLSVEQRVEVAHENAQKTPGQLLAM